MLDTKAELAGAGTIWLAAHGLTVQQAMTTMHRLAKAGGPPLGEADFVAAVRQDIADGTPPPVRRPYKRHG